MNQVKQFKNIQLKKDLVETLRYISFKNHTSIAKIIEDSLIEYVNNNQEELKELLALEKIPKKKIQYGIESDKDTVTFKINLDYYHIIKEDSLKRGMTLAQRIDKILSDYIDSHF